MELLLESKDAEIFALNKQLQHFRERNGLLDSTIRGMQEKMHGLESGMGRKNAEVLGLEGKLAEKYEELEVLERKNKLMKEQIDGLNEAVKELERKKSVWTQKEETSSRQIEQLSHLLEEKSKALTSALADATKSKDLCRASEGSLAQRAEELGRCRATCETLTTCLSACQNELKDLQEEREKQAKSTQEKLAASDFQLKELAKRLQAKVEEMEVMKKALDSKEAELECINEDARELREKNEAIDSTVGSVRGTLIAQSVRLTQRETEVSALEAKVAALEGKLGMKDEEMEAVFKRSKTLQEQNELLKQTVHEFERKKAEWVKNEDKYTRQNQELAALLEERSTELDTTVREAARQKERCKELVKSLNEKIEELKSCKSTCDSLQTSLSFREDEFKALEVETGEQIQALREKLSVSDLRLKDLTDRLKGKTDEVKSLIEELDNRDARLACVSEEARELRENNDALECTLQSLQNSLDSRLTHNAAELQDVSEKLAELQRSLVKKEEELQTVHEGREDIKDRLERQKQTRNELEKQKQEWTEKERDLQEQVLQLASLVEDQTAALESSKVELNEQVTKCGELERSLNEKVEQIKRSKNDQKALETTLIDCQNELKTLREKMGSETRLVKEKLSVSEFQLKEVVNRLNGKNIEMEQVTKTLQERETQLSFVTDEACGLRETVSSLKSTVEMYKLSVEALETRLKEKDSDLLCMAKKVTVTEELVGEREQGLERLTKENTTLQEQVDGLKQVVVELEDKKKEWLRKEEEHNRELQELRVTVEEKCANLESVIVELKVEVERREALELSLKTLEDSLKEKMDELGCCMNARDVLQESVYSLCEELRCLRLEREQQVMELREMLATYEYQTKEGEKAMNLKSAEMETVVKELGSKECELASAKDELQQLREKNSSLDFAMQSLQLKMASLSEELKKSETKGVKLFSDLAAAEASLSASRDLVSNLELKVELGNQISAKMEAANAKIKELESVLVELMAFAQDKDERLDASEWAVQQLGIFEVSKAKANLAQAERERVQMKHRCAELENELKAKEEEIVDLESCVRQLKDEEVEYEAMKRSMQSLATKYEGLKAEHEQLETSIAEYRSQAVYQAEEIYKLEEMVDKLKRDLLMSRQEAEAATNKLKEVQSELQVTQVSGRCLMQQMLLLHENLLEEGKALLDFGKDDADAKMLSPTRRHSLSNRETVEDHCLSGKNSVWDSGLPDRPTRKHTSKNMDFTETKENLPTTKMKSFSSAEDATCAERCPLQVLHV